MTEAELYKEADKLIADFASLELVRRYQIVSEACKKDSEINELQTKKATIQKGIKYMKDEKKDEAIKACKEIEIKISNSTLLVNRNSLLKEIYDLLLPLSDVEF